MSVQVKICGIKEPEALSAAVEGGARFVGFVFYPPSPRFVERDTAKELAMMLPTGVKAVGLFVDPADEELDYVIGHVQLDMIQLHGVESPGRVAEIKERFALPVMKAIAIGSKEDLMNVDEYEIVADWILFDTKLPPLTSPSLTGERGSLSGGTGKTFDWGVLKGRTFQKPWMLSGGLRVENVGAALAVLKPTAVDVSSGVEGARGVKDPAKIKTFLETVKGL